MEIVVFGGVLNCLCHSMVLERRQQTIVEFVVFKDIHQEYGLPLILPIAALVILVANDLDSSIKELVKPPHLARAFVWKKD